MKDSLGMHGVLQGDGGSSAPASSSAAGTPPLESAPHEAGREHQPSAFLS